MFHASEKLPFKKKSRLVRHRTWNSSCFPHAHFSMETETSFCRQPLRKGMQRWVLYTCFCQKTKKWNENIIQKRATSFYCWFNSSAYFLKVFHRTWLETWSKCVPLSPCTLCKVWTFWFEVPLQARAEIPSILSGVNPSSAPLQCLNKEKHQIRNEQKKIKKGAAYIWSLAFRTAMIQS